MSVLLMSEDKSKTSITGFCGAKEGISILFHDGPARAKIAATEPINAKMETKRLCLELPLISKKLSSFLSQTLTQLDKDCPL